MFTREKSKFKNIWKRPCWERTKPNKPNKANKPQQTPALQISSQSVQSAPSPIPIAIQLPAVASSAHQRLFVKQKQITFKRKLINAYKRTDTINQELIWLTLSVVVSWLRIEALVCFLLDYTRNNTNVDHSEQYRLANQLVSLSLKSLTLANPLPSNRTGNSSVFSTWLREG
jgi:hypothetical protein